MDAAGFIKGRVRVRISGRQPERFINLALRNNIYLYNIEKRGGEIYFTVSPRGFLLLRPIAAKTGIRAAIISKSGLFTYTKKLKKRKTLILLSSALFVFMLFISSLVLDIDITGNEILQNDEIIAKLSEIGLKKFTFRSKIDTDDIRLKLMKEFPSLAWAGVYENGTRITVDIRERVSPPAMVDKSIPCDLVAKKEGRIISVTAENGEKAVKVGDAVVKGQVLISGTIPVKNSEEKRYVHSMGSVIAETVLSRKADVRLYEYEKLYTGKEKSFLIIKVKGKTVFGERIPPWFNFDREEKRRVISFLEFNTVTLREYTLKKVKVGEEKALSDAKKELEQELRASAGGEVREIVHHVEYADEETRLLESVAYIKEEIAEEKEIEVWKESSAEEIREE